jgi:hypothetical protein
MPTRFSQYWSRQIIAKSAKVPFLGVSEGIDADGKAFSQLLLFLGCGTFISLPTPSQLPIFSSSVVAIHQASILSLIPRSAAFYGFDSSVSNMDYHMQAPGRDPDPDPDPDPADDRGDPMYHRRQGQTGEAFPEFDMSTVDPNMLSIDQNMFEEPAAQFAFPQMQHGHDSSRA